LPEKPKIKYFWPGRIAGPVGNLIKTQRPQMTNMRVFTLFIPFVLLTYLIPLQAVAQDTLRTAKDSVALKKAPILPDSTVFPPRLNSVYLELGGNALGISLTFEKLFKAKDKNYWSLKVGAGPFYKSDTTYLLLPVTFGKLYVKRRYLLEVAAGVAFYKGSPDTSGYYLTGILAYRKNLRNRKYFKLAFTPYMSLDIKSFDYRIYPYAGIGLGKYF
jgi:hypothetical protein